MADINIKLDRIISILAENEKKYKEDITNLNNTFENKMNKLEERIERLEKNTLKNNSKNSNNEINFSDKEIDDININDSSSNKKL